MRVGVGAIVFRGSELLLVRRRYPPSRGYWSIPGGHVKEGESLFEASRRELLEETGLEGKPVCIVSVDELLVKRRGRLERHYLLVDILFDVDSVERPVAGSDASDARFFNVYEAVRMDDVSLTTRGFLYRFVKTSGRLECDSLLESARSIVFE